VMCPDRERIKVERVVVLRAGALDVDLFVGRTCAGVRWALRPQDRPLPSWSSNRASSSPRLAMTHSRHPAA